MGGLGTNPPPRVGCNLVSAFGLTTILRSGDSNGGRLLLFVIINGEFGASKSDISSTSESSLGPVNRAGLSGPVNRPGLSGPVNRPGLSGPLISGRGATDLARSAILFTASIVV